MKREIKKVLSATMAGLLLMSAPITAFAASATSAINSVTGVAVQEVGEAFDATDAVAKITLADVNTVDYKLTDFKTDESTSAKTIKSTEVEVVVTEDDEATTDVDETVKANYVISYETDLVLTSTSELKISVTNTDDKDDVSTYSTGLNFGTVITEDNIKEYIDTVTLKFVDGVPTITAPALSGSLTAEVTVTKGSDVVSTFAVSNAEVVKSLDAITSATDYTITVKGYQNSVLISEVSKTVNLTSTESPVINYAYVIDGGLIINTTSESGLIDRPIYYKAVGDNSWTRLSADAGYGKTYNSSKTVNFDDLFVDEYEKYARLDENDYRIEVDIPSKVQVVITDNFGHETAETFTINSDNKALTSGTPSYLDDLYEKVKGTGDLYERAEEDLLIVSKDTTVDLITEFLDEMKDTWTSFNYREVEWECDNMTSFNMYSLKFKDEGRYVFTGSLDGSSKTVEFTVLVMDGANNIKSFSVNENTNVTTDTFVTADGIEFTTKNSKDANPTHFYATYDNKYYRLMDSIPFATEKDANATTASVTVRDMDNNKNHTVKFTKTASISGITTKTRAEAEAMYTDIDGHWAYDYIISATMKGYVQGYEENTSKLFKPDNMISLREVMAIVGRISAAQGDNAKAVVNEEVTFTESTWGNAEVKHTLQRLPINHFAGVDLERAATREEVSYIVASVFNFNSSTSEDGLTDIGTVNSNYATGVKQLISAGTITGYPDNTFKPQLSISRAETMTILDRIPSYALTK